MTYCSHLNPWASASAIVVYDTAGNAVMCFIQSLTWSRVIAARDTYSSLIAVPVFCEAARVQITSRRVYDLCHPPSETHMYQLVGIYLQGSDSLTPRPPGSINLKLQLIKIANGMRWELIITSKRENYQYFTVSKKYFQI